MKKTIIILTVVTLLVGFNTKAQSLDEEYYPSISEAIEKGDINALSEYINDKTSEQEGEDDDEIYDTDNSLDKRIEVLSTALDMGKFDIFEHFLKGYSDIIKSGFGWLQNTFLHEAAENGKLEIVHYLVEKGAEVNAANRDGYTPIILALENDYSEIVTFLLSRGANLNVIANEPPPNDSFTTPILFNYYYQNRSSTGRIDENYTLLKRFIEAGADIDIRDNSNETVLFHAAGGYGSDLGLTSFLIKNGADVNAKNDDGRTPLFGAIQLYDANIAKLLIDNQADINVTDNYFRTPLFDALSYGNEELVEYLLEKGANVNQKDMYGNTPLHIAAGEDDLKSVKLLVEKGADIHAKDNGGHTPIYKTDLSSKSGKSIIEYLKSKGADDEEAGLGGLLDIDFSF